MDVHEDTKPEFHADTKPEFHADTKPEFHADTKPEFHADTKQEFHADTKQPLIDLNLTDSTELWLIQWPINLAPDFDGQVVTLRAHRDGKLDSFEGSSGRLYDIVSFASQEPDATVLLSSVSDSKVVGKISRRVSLVHYPEPDEFVKGPFNNLKSMYLGSGTSTTRSSHRSTTVSRGTVTRKSTPFSTQDTCSVKSRSSSGGAFSKSNFGTPKSSRKRNHDSIGSMDRSTLESERSNKVGSSSDSARHSDSKRTKKMKIEKQSSLSSKS